MIRRLFLIAGVIRREFHAPALAAAVVLVYPVYWLLISAGLLLDRALPAGRKGGSTLIIAGPPRSGTTFLQRYLVEVTGGRATALWESLVPSASIQAITPAALLQRVPRLDLGHAHSTGPEFAEADDIGVFCRYLDSFFFYVYGLSWHRREFPEYLDPARRPAAVAARDLQWLRHVARRNQRRSGRGLAILKLFSAGFALTDALTVMPDARIVYVSRAPHETLPSSLSMVRAVLNAGGLYARTGPPARARHVHHLRQASLALQRAAVEQLAGAPADRVLVIRYEDLITDFAATMQRILAFSGIDVDALLLEELARQGEVQRDRTSAHHYDLASFGLSEQSIREGFREIYVRFGHESEPLECEARERDAGAGGAQEDPVAALKSA